PLADASSCLCIATPSAPASHRWVGCLPKEYPTSVSREGQRNGRQRKSLSAGVEGSVHCDRDQTDAEEACGRGHAQVNAGKGTASQRAVEAVARRLGLEHCFYRATQWHHA